MMTKTLPLFGPVDCYEATQDDLKHGLLEIWIPNQEYQTRVWAATDKRFLVVELVKSQSQNNFLQYSELYLVPLKQLNEEFMKMLLLGAVMQYNYLYN